jgi:hypothetical protein
MDNNIYVHGTWIDHEILLETIENPNENEDKPQNEEEITVFTI